MLAAFAALTAAIFALGAGTAAPTPRSTSSLTASRRRGFRGKLAGHPAGGHAGEDVRPHHAAFRNITDDVTQPEPRRHRLLQSAALLAEEIRS